MIKTRNAAERFALRAFAAARRAEEYEGPVFHEQNLFIPQIRLLSQPLKSARLRNWLKSPISTRPSDRHLLVDPPDQSARCHRPAQKLCNRVQVPRFSRVKIS